MKKYSVDTPFGTLTRKTDRTYTHVVVGLGIRECVLRDQFASELRWHEKVAAEYRAKAEGRLPSRFESLDDCREQEAIYRNKIETNAERLEQALENNRKIIESRERFATTWAGSPELAAKAATRFAVTYHTVEVFAVELEVKR